MPPLHQPPQDVCGAPRAASAAPQATGFESICAAACALNAFRTIKTSQVFLARTRTAAGDMRALAKFIQDCSTSVYFT